MKLIRLIFILMFTLVSTGTIAEEAVHETEQSSPWKLICFKNEKACRSLWIAVDAPEGHGSIQVAYNVQLQKKGPPTATFTVNLDAITLDKDKRSIVVNTDTSKPMTIPVIADDFGGVSAELKNPQTINTLLSRMERATAFFVNYEEEGKLKTTTVKIPLTGFAGEMEYMISGDALMVKY